MNTAVSQTARVVCSALCIVLITLAAYSGSLRNDFVDWDDQEYVANNPLIKNLSLPAIRELFTRTYQATYNPLVFLSFAVEYSLIRLNPFYYHLNNTILHCINSVLVFFLVMLLSKNLLLSLLSGVLFGVHPLHVESVAWVAERKDVLSAVFFLSAFIGYIFYCRRRTIARYCGILLLFLLSLLSKPAGITLPIMLIAYDVLVLNRRGMSVLRDKIPFILISLIFGGITLYVQQTGGGVDIEVSYSLAEKVFIVYYSYFFYILKTLFPVTLSALYPYPKIIEFLSPLSCLSCICVALCAAAVFYFRTCRVMTFYALFFFITLVPGLKVIPFGNSIVADRFAYIPSLGLLALLATGIVALCNQSARWKLTAGVCCSIIITACFALLTYERCSVWKDSMALWTDTVRKSPEAELAQYGLGSAYWKAGDLHKAIAAYNRALSLAPSFIDAHISLGNALRVIGKHAEATEQIKKSLAFDVKKPRSYLALGEICREAGNLDEALSYYSTAVRADATLAEAYVGIGNVYRKKGLPEKALAAYNQALALNPDSPTLYTERGLFYREQGKIEEAILNYNTALALDPRYAEAHNNLGWLYQQQGQYDQALQCLEKAIASNPSLLTAYDNMVQVYLKQNNRQQAVATYRRCLAANETADAFQRLVGLYYRLGMKDDIVQYCEMLQPGSPLYADGLLCLGEYYRKEGNLQKAVDLYQQARAARNTDPRIFFSLGMAFLQQGRIPDARENLEQAKALGFKNPALCTKLGVIYFNQGMADRALREFSEALEIDPRGIVPHLYLAQIYSGTLQNKQQAVDHLKKVLEIDPRIPQADTIRADIQRLEKEIK